MFQPVDTRRESRHWNEFMARYHYLGYQPLPGAQIRYRVRGDGGRLLALLGFGAAAWAVAPRDQFIGWSAEQRVQHLHQVVNNARFLILPWGYLGTPYGLPAIGSTCLGHGPMAQSAMLWINPATWTGKRNGPSWRPRHLS